MHVFVCPLLLVTATNAAPAKPKQCPLEAPIPCHNTQCCQNIQFCGHKSEECESCFPLDMPDESLLEWCQTIEMLNDTASRYRSRSCLDACYLKFRVKIFTVPTRPNSTRSSSSSSPHCPSYQGLSYFVCIAVWALLIVFSVCCCCFGQKVVVNVRSACHNFWTRKETSIRRSDSLESVTKGDAGEGHGDASDDELLERNHGGGDNQPQFERVRLSQIKNGGVNATGNDPGERRVHEETGGEPDNQVNVTSGDDETDSASDTPRPGVQLTDGSRDYNRHNPVLQETNGIA